MTYEYTYFFKKKLLILQINLASLLKSFASQIHLFVLKLVWQVCKRSISDVFTEKNYPSSNFIPLN